MTQPKTLAQLSAAVRAAERASYSDAEEYFWRELEAYAEGEVVASSLSSSTAEVVWAAALDAVYVGQRGRWSSRGTLYYDVAAGYREYRKLIAIGQVDVAEDAEDSDFPDEWELGAHAGNGRYYLTHETGYFVLVNPRSDLEWGDDAEATDQVSRDEVAEELAGLLADVREAVSE